MDKNEKANEILEAIATRITKNLDWFQRLEPYQIGGSMNEIMYYNISPIISILSLYQDFDKPKYEALANDLMMRAQVFYIKQNPYPGDVILREMGDYAIIGYQMALADSEQHPLADSTNLKIEHDIMRQVLALMNQYNPKLLERYQKVNQDNN